MGQCILKRQPVGWRLKGCIVTVPNFLSLSDAAFCLAKGNDEEIAIWLAVLIGAVEREEITVLKSWRDTTSPFSFQREPSEWRVLKVILSKWISANGYGEPVAKNGTEPTTQESQDPERRLARLRQLGGGARFNKAKGAWTFTGMAALVAREKADGRKRSDEKTIRADLSAAAHDERDAQSAGPFDGLVRR